MINSTEIRYFVELATVGHVSRAAERLGITQPALSHSLKKMELDLGYPLFLRSKRGVTLTSPGQNLLRHCEALADAWKRVRDNIQEDVEQVSGIVRLGCHTAVAQYTLPLILPRLLKDNPHLNIQLRHSLSRHVTEQVVSSQLDIGIVVNPSMNPDLVIKEVCRDRVTLWRSQKCLNNDVLILEPNLLQTQDITAKMAKKGFHFSRKIESDSLEVISQLLIAGAGCAILPERVVKAFTDEKVAPFKDAPIFEDRICLVYKREFSKLKRGKTFIEAARAAIY